MTSAKRIVGNCRDDPAARSCIRVYSGASSNRRWVAFKAKTRLGGRICCPFKQPTAEDGLRDSFQIRS
jgi:hypothetical protein